MAQFPLNIIALLLDKKIILVEVSTIVMVREKPIITQMVSLIRNHKIYNLLVLMITINCRLKMVQETWL